MNYNLPIKDIYKAASDANAFTQGQALFQSRAVTGVSSEYCGKNDNELRTCVTAYVKDGGHTYAPMLYFGQDRGFFSCRCGCSAASVWRGACRHVVAVLLYLQRSESAVLNKSYEKQIIGSLMKLFENNLTENINMALGTGGVALAPSLAFSERGAAVSLKIGAGRMYVLRSVHKFLNDLEMGNTVEYGKMLSFKHKLSAFDQKSRRLAELLLAQQKTEREIYSKDSYYGYGGYYNARYNAGGFTLLRGSFDALFDIYKGSHLPVAAAREKERAVLLSEGAYDPGFRLEETAGGILLKGESRDGRFDEYFYEGEEFTYVIVNDAMYRIEKTAAAAVAPIKKALSETFPRGLGFEGRARDSFLSYLYPTLKNQGLLRQSDELSRIDEIFMPAAKAYLDSDAARVTCRLVFDYGGRLVNPNDESSGRGGFRNLLEEARVTALLGRYGFAPENDAFSLRDEERIFDFYLDGVNEVRGAAEVYATEAFDRRALKKKSNARLGVRIDGGLLSLELDSEYTLPELVEALGSYMAKKRYHRLKDGRFVDLGDADITRIEDVIAAADISKRDQTAGGRAFTMPLYRANLLKSAAEAHGAFDLDASVNRLCEDLAHYDTGEGNIPDSLVHILRGYQKTGFNWLRMLARHGFGGILADDMGLGKTLQIIALLLHYKEQGSRKRSIVVTPASLIYNWEKEIKRYAPGLNVTVLAGTPQMRKELFNGPETDAYITTYDLLKRDIDNYADTEFLFCVADEAQYIKNAGTRNAAAIKQIKAEARFALTGTPIENALSELWSIFDFVMPGFLHSASKFSRLYEIPIVKHDDGERAERLKKQIAPFVLRRLKSQVLQELPEKIETSLFADMTEQQKKLYTANLLSARAEFESAVSGGVFEESRIKILALLTRLRQLCCHPALFLENYKHGSGKLDLCVETVKTALSAGHRVLIFSQFTSMLAIIMGELDKEGVSYFYLDGQTPSRLRMSMSDDFNAGARQAFLISLRAGGTGLNLIGADIVIHYDPWWNPAVMQQASDRAHRIGQRKAVQIINLVTRNTIEEKILELQEKKKNLTDSVILASDGAGFLNRMSKEEIRELFAD